MGLAVDAALDLEQGIDTFDHLHTDRGNDDGLLALAFTTRSGLIIGYGKERPAGMEPTCCLQVHAGLPGQQVKLVVATIRVRLEQPAPCLQMLEGMLFGPIP